MNRHEILENKESMEEGDVEHEFLIMQRANREVAEEVIGRPHKKKKPWISEESWNLVDQRNEWECIEMIEEIAVNEPTIVEVEVAIQRMNSGKAPGINSITAELLKVCIGFSAHKVHELMVEVWKNEKIPENWKKGLIKLPKKENLKECKNFRGVTLLSVVGKILGRIIIDRIGEGVDGKLQKGANKLQKRERNHGPSIHITEHH